MTILKVLHFPDERLRLKASPVKEITSEINNIAENMLETMYTEGGIGLAATQVNIQKRIWAVVHARLVDLHRRFVPEMRRERFDEGLEFVLVPQAEAADGSGVDAYSRMQEFPFLC